MTVAHEETAMDEVISAFPGLLEVAEQTAAEVRVAEDGFGALRGGVGGRFGVGHLILRSLGCAIRWE